MIVFKIKELLEKENMSRYKLRQYSGFTYERVNDYYFGRVKSIKKEELEALCKIFKCNTIDIIEYKKE
jgi:DNA-binding Xre family transcriptional regulator